MAPADSHASPINHHCELHPVDKMCSETEASTTGAGAMEACRTGAGAVEAEETISSVSLNQLVRLYSDRETWVQPLLWTSHHLRWLDCLFVDDPASDDESDNRNFSNMSTQLVRLATGHNSIKRREALQNLIPHTFDSSYVQMRLKVRRRTMHIFLCHLYHEGFDDDAPVSFATIDHNDVRQCRNTLPPYEQDTDNHWSQDPYLFCILIALAQKQRRRIHPPMSLDSLVLTPHLIVSRESGSGLQLYRAEVPFLYLHMLDQSNFRLPQPAPVLINRTEIPFMPGRTFTNRLADILEKTGTWKYKHSYMAPDMATASELATALNFLAVPESNASYLENNGSKAQLSPRSNGWKRKHDVVGEESSRSGKRSPIGFECSSKTTDDFTMTSNLNDII